MRLLPWLLLPVAAAALYLYFDPDNGGSLADRLPRPDLIKKTDRLYQWRDADGHWQVTDTPPPEGITYQVRDYRDDVNVLPVPPGTGRTP